MIMIITRRKYENHAVLLSELFAVGLLFVDYASSDCSVEYHGLNKFGLTHSSKASKKYLSLYIILPSFTIS